jgi:hypothetical protein
MGDLFKLFDLIGKIADLRSSLRRMRELRAKRTAANQSRRGPNPDPDNKAAGPQAP